MRQTLTGEGSTSNGVTTWSETQSANQGTNQNNYLNATSCVSSTWCMAAGDYVDSSGVYQTLTEYWNGASWSAVSSQDSSSSDNNYLNGVSCTSSSLCIAAGYYIDSSGVAQTLIESYNGTSWSTMTSQDTSSSEDNYLYAATCASSSECYAVGYYYDSSSGLYHTLIEYWNGTSWSIISSSGAAGGSNYLYGISCQASNNCFASGYYYNTTAGVYQPLIEQGDSGGFDVGGQLSSLSVGTSNNYLYGISCASGATDCYAVGYYYDTSNDVYQTLVVDWSVSGASGSTVTSANETGGVSGKTPTNNYLYGISCVSSTSCETVGYFLGGVSPQGNILPGSTDTMIQSGDYTNGFTVTGNIWSPGSWSGWLTSISCPSSSSCETAGYFSFKQTLIESWSQSTGSWSIVSSPNVGTDVTNTLSGVSCVSSTFCVAVGAYYDTSAQAYLSLIESYNGTSWSVVAGANGSTSSYSSNSLLDVTCTSATYCVAVGNYEDPPNFTTGASSPTETLIETWNGSSWSLDTSTDPSSTFNYLFGISCASSTSCVTVGFYDNSSGVFQTLAEYWNGASWSTMASQDSSSSEDNYLFGVSCTSSTSCTAVGNYIDSSGVSQTLTEYWNGASWSTVSSQDSSSSDNNYLNGVSCTSSSNCMAVGNYIASGVTYTLTESFNGASWSIDTSTNPSSVLNILYGVYCSSSSSCLATGVDTGSSGMHQSLAELWS